jgi:hypothetical protein
MDARNKKISEFITSLVEHESDYSAFLDVLYADRPDLRPCMDWNLKFRPGVMANGIFNILNSICNQELNANRDEVIGAINNFYKWTGDRAKRDKGLGNYTGFGVVLGTRKVGFAVQELANGKMRKELVNETARSLEHTVLKVLKESENKPAMKF